MTPVETCTALGMKTDVDASLAWKNALAPGHSEVESLSSPELKDYWKALLRSPIHWQSPDPFTTERQERPAHPTFADLLHRDQPSEGALRATKHFAKRHLASACALFPRDILNVLYLASCLQAHRQGFSISSLSIETMWRNADSLVRHYDWLDKETIRLLRHAPGQPEPYTE